MVDRSFLGLVPYRHYGIELPDGTICENSPPGVRIVGYADFARGRDSQVVNPEASPAERNLAVQRALSRVGERRWCTEGANLTPPRDLPVSEVLRSRRRLPVPVGQRP